jgi:hypothetical protein
MVIRTLIGFALIVAVGLICVAAKEPFLRMFERGGMWGGSVPREEAERDFRIVVGLVFGLAALGAISAIVELLRR